MSKRARITLNAESETEPDGSKGAEPLPETGTPSRNGFRAAANKPSGPATPTRGSVGVGTIVKAVFAGLAVASLVLLWKNRRP